MSVNTPNNILLVRILKVNLNPCSNKVELQVLPYIVIALFFFFFSPFKVNPWKVQIHGDKPNCCPSSSSDLIGTIGSPITLERRNPGLVHTLLIPYSALHPVLQAGRQACLEILGIQERCKALTLINFVSLLWWVFKLLMIRLQFITDLSIA